jgi:FAD/FMN-containing dehydrogenase
METLRTPREASSPPIIRPGTPHYEQARRVWNGMIDRHPWAIIECTSTDDVIFGIHLARDEGRLIAIRGGGHNVAGFATCDDGIVLDLTPMNRIEMNVGEHEVWVGGGARWGEIDRATQAHGMIVPGGLVSTTGVGGFTLGGGLSWTRNLYGATCDSLMGAEVVLADGSVVETSELHEPDLLWGLRGGGGNFGVVTRFRFRMYSLGPDVYQLAAFYDGEGDAMARAIRHFLAYCEEAPDEVSPLLGTGMFPPGHEHFPVHLHGRAFVLFGAVYAGNAEEGRRALAPLHSFAEPLVDISGVKPYVEAQAFLDDDYPAHVLRYYWKSAQFTEVTDDVINVIIEQSRKQPSPFSTIDLWYNAGVFARTPDDSAAFSGRSARYMVNPEANWLEEADDAANLAWVRECDRRLKPHSTGLRYFNFPGMHEGGADDMRQTFGRKYDRLRQIKHRYDPENLFRLNQNIVT